MFKSQWNALAHCKNILLIVFFSSLTCELFAQAAPPACKALVQIQNDLWFVGRDGAMIQRLTNDNAAKIAAAISQDGKLVAFSNLQSQKTVTLIDSAGRYIMNVDVNATDAVTNLKWLDNDVLRVQEHLGPSASVYHFLDTSRSRIKATKSLGRELAIGTGGGCAFSIKEEKTACINGDAVSVNHRDVYFLSDAFANASKLQTLELNHGRIVSSSTRPVFSFEMKSYTNDEVEIRVTTEDNLWQTDYVRFGETAPIKISSELLSDEPNAMFGFTPMKKSRSSGVVTVNLLKSNGGKIEFEGDLSMDPSGKRLAAIEVNGRNERTLVLRHLNHFDDKEDENNGPESQYKVIRILLPIDGPISSVEFTAAPSIRVVGSNQVFEQGLSSRGPNMLEGNPKILPALPTDLVITGSSIDRVPVLAWTCSAM